MDENPAIEPPPKEANFFVWSAARRIGVARKSADGGIVVKLDPGEVSKAAIYSPFIPPRRNRSLANLRPHRRKTPP
jgi:hypothetical protein